jgi:hypothetical protein
VFPYFEIPRDWTRLYGLAGRVEELGAGWPVTLVDPGTIFSSLETEAHEGVSFA